MAHACTFYQKESYSFGPVPYQIRFTPHIITLRLSVILIISVIERLKYRYDRGRFWVKEKCFIEKKKLVLYMLELRLLFSQLYVSAH